MRLRTIPALIALGALVMTSMPGRAMADPDLSSSGFRPNAYTFAASCDLAQPLLFINVLLRNTGDAPSESVVVKALDVTKVFNGELTVPSIIPRADMAVQVPLRATDAALQPGAHVITVFVGGRALKPLVVQVPATLCPASAAANGRTRPASVAQETTTRSTAPMPKTRAQGPQRIMTPQMFYLGNLPWDCTLGVDPCVQAMARRSLQVAFDWRPCILPTCAQKIARFEIYRVPHGGSQPRLKRTDTATVAETISRTPLSDDDIDAPIPQANAALPPGFTQVASGTTNATVFLSSFAIGDCYAVRVQSEQGYYSQLSSGMCVDRLTPIGIAESDVPSDRPLAIEYGSRECFGDTVRTEGVELVVAQKDTDTPFVGFNPQRKCYNDAVVRFRLPTPQPMWLVTAWLIADGNARCVNSLGIVDDPWNHTASRRVIRAGNVLKDDITTWVSDRAGDFTVRIFGGKDCYERLSNFRIHLIAPARNTAREPIHGFSLPSWFQPVKQ